MSKQIRTYEPPEDYKVGWVHGFYSCGFSDIAFDDGSRCKPRPPTTNGTKRSLGLYFEGYENGRRSRMQNKRSFELLQIRARKPA